MNNIEVKVLNPEAIESSKKTLVCAARLTQRGHKINSLEGFLELYNKDYSERLLQNLVNLPHPTLQKFGVINVIVVGASRRFLAQITRHQNEVKFISASLQYSDYSDAGTYCVPYEIKEAGELFVYSYLKACDEIMTIYKSLAAAAGNDAAGYIAPQGLRNLLLISATPFQWKHMIRQRTCRRNTKETEYVMLKIWNELKTISPELFSDCGPFCSRGGCPEGKMSCGDPIKPTDGPLDILHSDFPLYYKEEK